MYINLFSHYSFFLAIFVAFTYNKKQPPACGATLAFWCILFSPFLGLLFCHIPNILSNYNVLTANAPFFYQISGTWSNHEGSILLWCWISRVSLSLLFGRYGTKRLRAGHLSYRAIEAARRAIIVVIRLLLLYHHVIFGPLWGGDLLGLELFMSKPIEGAPQPAPEYDGPIDQLLLRIEDHLSGRDDVMQQVSHQVAQGRAALTAMIFVGNANAPSCVEEVIDQIDANPSFLDNLVDLFLP